MFARDQTMVAQTVFARDPMVFAYEQNYVCSYDVAQMMFARDQVIFAHEQNHVCS